MPPEAEKPPTVEGAPRIDDREAPDVLGDQRGLAEAFGLCADQSKHPALRAVACTVSTRIGSLNREPVRTWPATIRTMPATRGDHQMPPLEIGLSSRFRPHAIQRAAKAA